jgi:hypothetical membrane protein
MMGGRYILFRKLTCLTGLAGVSIIGLGVLISALGFTGAYGESFSPLNHNISELGEVEVSGLAWVFNNSLIIGGLSLILFMLGLSLSVRHWPVYLISLTGVVAISGMILTGLTPMSAGETSGLHIDAARLFFYGGMSATFIYSLYVGLGRRGEFPRWTAILSFLSLASFWAFIYLPAILEPGFQIEDYLVRMQGAARPDLFLPSLLEWLVMFFTVLWIGVLAVILCRNEEG